MRSSRTPRRADCGNSPERQDTQSSGAAQEYASCPQRPPDPSASMARMRSALPADALVGAGTVLRVDDIERVKAAGGKLIVMPHADPAVIRAAKAAGLICVPGAMTPTEAFAALDAGADALKLFPAELISPRIVKALRAVLPKAT